MLSAPMRDSTGHVARGRLDIAAVRGVAIALGFGLVVLAIYGHTLHDPFVFDDIDAIVDNESLRSLATAFAPPPDTPVSGRPLVNLSFALQVLAGGLAPFGFRLVNLALHALNALLAYALVVRVLARPGVPERIRAHASECALLSALLWACHPLQSEAVLYVTQRTELMAGACVLLSVLCALRYLQAPSAPSARMQLLLAALGCCVGGACKESVVAIPVVVLALDLAFFGRSFASAWRAHRALYGALGLSLVPLLLPLMASARDRTTGLDLGVTAWQSLALGGHALLWYLRLAVWPAPLSVTYNWSYHAHYWAEDATAAALFVLSLVALRARPWLGAAGLWVFALLAPSTSLIPIISEVAAERRMYLPLLALVTVAVGLAHYVAKTRRELAIGACLLLTAASAWRSHGRAHDFDSAQTLFAAALRADPDNPQAMWGLARALDDRGQTDRALSWYERMAAKPYPYAGPASWGTRGLMAAADIYRRRGDDLHARDAVRRALEHDPDSAIGKLQRAARLAAEGRDDAAIALLHDMLHQPFLLGRVHRELAGLYLRRGDQAAARLQLRAAATAPTR
jgi:tetratricopeptide (TPR) repeat protein